MKIGFVAEPYEESNASGMGYVVVEMMRYLAAAGSAHEFIYYSSKPIDPAFVPGAYRNVIIPRGFLNKLWFFFRLKEKPDVIISMVPMLPLIVRSTKYVPMCQELASQKITPIGAREKLFAFMRDQVLMRISLARAAKVIAASEATKADLMRFYGMRGDRIAVSYDGFQSLDRFAADATLVDASLTPYFFFVGKVKPRKNVHGIVAAFIALKERGKQCKLVLAGDYGGDYYESIKKEIDAHGCADDIHFIGYATGALLYAYYVNAVACLFPSLNEGFGMPIVEAMSLGVPVITSDISSMSEVAGDAAILVDPHDVADLSQAMERMLGDEALRTELIEKGKERAAQFSWPKAAREYIAVAESV